MKLKIIQTSASIELYIEAFGESINGACLLISGAMAPAGFGQIHFVSLWH